MTVASIAPAVTIGSHQRPPSVIVRDLPRPIFGKMAIRTYVALLEAPAFRRVAHALARDGFVLGNCSAASLLECLHGPSHVSVVLDPTLVSGDAIAESIAALTSVPRPMVVYAPLTPDGIARGMAFARQTTASVLFQAVDQDLGALSQSLVSASDSTYGRKMLGVLAPQLRPLPMRLRTAIEDMFLIAGSAETPATLARRATLCRRSLNRRLAGSGFASVRLLAAVPQLLRALALLRETELTVRRISEIAAYPSTRRLTNHALELTGLTPAELRKCPDLAPVLESIAVKLVRTPIVSSPEAHAIEPVQPLLHARAS